MQIKLISGNFAALVSFDGIASGNVNLGSDEKPKLVPAAEVVTDCGMTYIGQRDGWTNFYKPRLAKGQERDELEYSEENAAEVAKSLTETLGAYASNISIEVVEHEKGETVSEMKRATALVDTFLGKPTEMAYRNVLGAGATPSVDASELDRDALIKLAHEQKLGITPPREKKNKTAKAE